MRKEGSSGLNAALAGKSYGTSDYEVTREAIADYARATNDPNPRYLDEGTPVASPVFPVVCVFGSFMAAATDPELGADLRRLVHGAEEHVLYRPLMAGEKLAVSSTLESVDPDAQTFTVAGTITGTEGDLAAEIRGTMFIRGPGSARALAAAEDPGAPGAIVYEETTHVDDDQPQRYADASGDHNPIHLDRRSARLSGLPGVILHGMCTMAMATKAAVNGLAGGDPSRIRRVAVRFTRPVLPGQDLTTRLWHGGGETGSFSFETYNPGGIAVIKHGVVEIST